MALTTKFRTRQDRPKSDTRTGVRADRTQDVRDQGAVRARRRRDALRQDTRALEQRPPTVDVDELAEEQGGDELAEEEGDDASQ